MSHHKEEYLDFVWVLARINAMIEESIYYTDTFAHSLKVHHNDKAAKVFDLNCEQFKAEQNIVLNYTINVDLPNIPPWEVPYAGYQHPSSVLIDATYLMTESEAWKLMSGMIEIHNSFYNFLFKENKEGDLIHIVDQLVNYRNQCGQENKGPKVKAETKQIESLEDLDVISLHSSEGGLW